MSNGELPPRNLHEEQGVRPEDYIDRNEYNRRIGIIQKAVFETLVKRDKDFNGTDGVEGVLVAGSYAKSHPTFGERIWVHRESVIVQESDLDIIHILSRPPEQLPMLNKQQGEEYQRAIKNNPQRAEFLILQNDAIQGFSIALERQLKSMGLRIEIEQLSDDLDLTATEEHWRSELANDPTDNPLCDAGLLFLTPGSSYREKIIRMLQVGNLPITLNPATESLRIK